MRWQFKVSLFLSVLAWTMFLGFAAYNTDNSLRYPSGDLEVTPIVGYSWIWYHPEQWMISLFLNLFAVVMFIYGVVAGIKQSGWNFSDFIKIEIIEETEEPRLI